MTARERPAIPAATLILFRDRPGADAELLFVERAASMTFAPGAIVFPGGRIDPGDEAAAAALTGAGDDGAARIAAIRETIEETGVAVGLLPAAPPDRIARLRSQLSAGRPIAAALADGQLQLDPTALTLFARWRPTHRPARAFDTHFYLARAPADAVATADGQENVRLRWSSAAALLAEADAGQATVIFPTRCNLERLARLPTLAAARADAAAHPVRLIEPWIERRGADDDLLCIPADAGYPIASRPVADATRG